MATSSTVPGFVPVDSPTYTTPVQVTGHTVNNLTVARTPLGKAIFGWSSGGIYYCAVDPDFDDVYRDDVIPDGDERIVLNGPAIGEVAYFGSLWVDRGDLYCAIKSTRQVGPTIQGKSLCYIADDVEDPQVWTVRGTIDTFAGSALIQDITSCGPVTILESGRWLLPFPMWSSYAGGAIADFSGIAYSDDLGLDWTVVVKERLSPLLSASTGPISDTIGQDPLTGYLYWAIYLGEDPNDGIIYESTDDGTTWSAIGSQVRVWNFSIDNGVDKLYATGDSAPSEWEFWETPDPSLSSTFIDLNLTAIPSRQNVQFQAIVFLEHGSIAFIDTNRIAGYFFTDCILPDPLFIPYKDRLKQLDFDADGIPLPDSFHEMAVHDFDNMKVIENWAKVWMDEAQAADRCDLFIPYKEHLLKGATLPTRVAPLTQASLTTIARLAFENYREIERWALCITRGECGCAGPDKCLLFIPFKNAANSIVVNETGSWEQAIWQRTADKDFDNYKTIELWANEWARGICSTGGSGFVFPPGGFPTPPVSPARLAGQMLEVSTQTPGSARLAGQILEVSTQADGSARLAGQMLEVAVVV